MTLQPTDSIHTAPQGVFRSTQQCALSFLLAFALAFASTSVDAIGSAADDDVHGIAPARREARLEIG